ncbi:MAG TPA: hypothetical protein VK400_16820 [Pyrinomonadaceae bacterium]|nr:hypothetical protein [Pyrinomonadaceae bacterium]
MFKTTIGTLLTFAVMFLLGNSFWAQTAQAQTTISREQWEAFFSSADKSAVWTGGKISFLRLAIPNVGEKEFSFIHTADDKFFTLTGEYGLNLGVSGFDDRRVQSITMPDGKKVFINWTQNSAGDWIPDTLECENNLIPAPGGSNPCRDALAAITVAAFVCSLAPGSVGCLGATANAAYHTYRCYEATHLAINPNNLNNLKNYAGRFESARKSPNKWKPEKKIRLRKS